MHSPARASQGSCQASLSKFISSDTQAHQEHRSPAEWGSPCSSARSSTLPTNAPMRTEPHPLRRPSEISPAICANPGTRQSAPSYSHLVLASHQDPIQNAGCNSSNFAHSRPRAPREQRTPGPRPSPCPAQPRPAAVGTCSCRERRVQAAKSAAQSPGTRPLSPGPRGLEAGLHRGSPEEPVEKLYKVSVGWRRPGARTHLAEGVRRPVPVPHAGRRGSSGALEAPGRPPPVPSCARASPICTHSPSHGLIS